MKRLLKEGKKKESVLPFDEEERIGGSMTFKEKEELFKEMQTLRCQSRDQARRKLRV